VPACHKKRQKTGRIILNVKLMYCMKDWKKGEDIPWDPIWSLPSSPADQKWAGFAGMTKSLVGSDLEKERTVGKAGRSRQEPQATRGVLFQLTIRKAGRPGVA
jgi:hypothetical protein